MKNHLKELSLNQSVGGTNSSVSSNPTQSVDVHYVQSSTNTNGNQQLGGTKNKERNNYKGGKNGNNPRTIIIMRRWVVMLERENKKDVR
jgi:hypothetical protein